MGGLAVLPAIRRTVLPLVRAALGARPLLRRRPILFFSMRSILACFLLAAAAIGCAAGSPPQYDSPIPGTIGVAVARDGGGVFVAAVRPGSAAARAGVHVGDRIERLNGEKVTDARQFERRVLDSPPGAILRLDILFGNTTRTIKLPVEEISTASTA